MPGLVGLLALGLAICVVAVTWLTFYRLTRPHRRTYASALARGQPGEPCELLSLAAAPFRRHNAPLFHQWTFLSRGQPLIAWEIPGGCPRGDIVILSHGWGDSKIGSLSRLDALARSGYLARNIATLIAWDLPGHGESPGVCSLGTHETQDLSTLIQLCCDSAPEATGVVLLGWSLGAGISIAAAVDSQARSHAPVRGVIAEAPYIDPLTPARNVLLRAALPAGPTLALAVRLVGWLHRARWTNFSRVALAARLPCPLLVIRGDQDAVSPQEHAIAIANAAGPRGDLVVIPGGGHHGLWAGERGIQLADHVAKVLGWTPKPQ